MRRTLIVVALALSLAGCTSQPVASPVTVTTTVSTTVTTSVTTTSTVTSTVEVEPEYASEEIRVCTETRNEMAANSITDMIIAVANGQTDLISLRWATVQMAWRPLDPGDARGSVSSSISVMNQLMEQLAEEDNESVYLPAVGDQYFSIRNACLNIGADWPMNGQE